jgi:predicted RND superfamily exporter protein
VEEPFNEMLHYGYPKYFGIPSTIDLAGNIWTMFLAGAAPGEMQYYISTEDSRDTCIRIMLSDHTYSTLVDLNKRLQEFVRIHFSKQLTAAGVQFRFLGGVAGLYSAANDVLYRLDLINITFVLLVIFTFCLFTFSSFVAAGLFLLACVLANFAAFIYMSMRDIGLTIDTIPVISLGIGLGIDYGIYTVSRIRDEVIGGLKLDDAIEVALRTTGVAVFTTFLVMVGGIFPWAFSPVAFHNGMSVLLMFLMATNMIAGVLVLPSYISFARPRFISQYEREEQIEASQGLTNK